MEEDALLINDLRDQITHNNTAWEIKYLRDSGYLFQLTI